MYLIYKLLRNLVRAIASDAAPWQIALGALLGTLVGLLPVWPLSHGYGPAPLGCALLLIALVVNCHLASFLLWLGIGKLLALALAGPAVSIGEAAAGLAQASADIPLLHLSLWDHTGYLGKTLLGFAIAPLAAIAMAILAVWFRRRWLPVLRERRRLLQAGSMVNRAWLVRLTCWFFGL